MTLIEGVGDEVTILVTVLLLLLILCLAWISTNVPDLGGIRVIILDHTNFHRLGEIARRYQIIGYQIISGHVVHNRENGNRDQDESQSGGEGDEGSEHSSAEDTTREGSGEEDSPYNSRNASRENVSQSATGPEVVTATECASSSTTEVTSTSAHTSVHTTAHTSAHTSVRRDSQSVENVPQDSALVDNGSEKCDATTVDSLRTELLSAASDNNASDGDSSELRRRRLAFFDKSDNGDSENEGSSRNVISNVTPAPSGDDVPLDGSSVDGSNQTSSTDSTDNTQSAHTDSAEPPVGHMRVRIKYLDDRQRQVEATPTETIGEFKRKHFAGELAENMLVRFIHNGRELRHEASTLQSCNITDGSVIHCLLTRGAQAEEPTNQQVQDEEFNMGALMFPLFGLILATIWYCRFTYRHYFNAMSTLILVGITLLYMIAGMAMYRNHVDHHQHQD